MVNDSGDHKFFQNKETIVVLNGLISQTLDLKQDLNVTINEIRKLLESYKKKEILTKKNQKIPGDNNSIKNKIKKSSPKQSSGGGNTNIFKKVQKIPKIKSPPPSPSPNNSDKSEEINVINKNLLNLENADFTKLELPELDNGVLGMLQLDINQKLLESVEKIDKKLNNLNTRFKKKLTIIKKFKRSPKKPTPGVKSKSGNPKTNQKPTDENLSKTCAPKELNETSETNENNNNNIDCLDSNYSENNSSSSSKINSSNNNNSSNSIKNIKSPLKPVLVKKLDDFKGNKTKELEKIIKPQSQTEKFSPELIKQMEAEKELLEMEAEAEKRILFAISYENNKKKAFKLNIIDKVNGNILDHLNLTKEELSRLNSAKIFKKYSSVYMLQKPIDFDNHFYK